MGERRFMVIMVLVLSQSEPSKLKLLFVEWMGTAITPFDFM